MDRSTLHLILAAAAGAAAAVLYLRRGSGLPAARSSSPAAYDPIPIPGAGSGLLLPGGQAWVPPDPWASQGGRENLFI